MREFLSKEKRKERFWTFVNFGPHPKNCWEWKGANKGTFKKQYGLFWNGVKMEGASKISFFQTHPAILIGCKCILHRCDNPKCVRPSHLFLGSVKDNYEDAMRKGRHYNARRFKTEREEMQ